MTTVSFIQPGVTFPPSSAHVWGAPDGCPAFVHALRAYPRTTSDAADEGTTAHKLAAEAFPQSAAIGQAVVPDCIDADMARHVHSYVAACLADGQSANPQAAKFGVEDKLILRNIHQRCTGYVDFWWWSEAELSVWDLKYGYGVVDVYRNWQLAAYASTLLRMMGHAPGAWPAGFQVHLHIYQPRAAHPDGPHRVWTTDPETIFGMEGQLRNAAAVADTKPFCRSGNHCARCAARYECAAGRKWAYSALSYLETPVREEFTPEEIGQELVVLEQAMHAIKSRTDAARAEVERHLKSGAPISTWHYEDTQSAMYWNDRASAGPTLEALGFPSIMKPAEPCTPKQAIDRGVPASVITAFAKRTPGKKLVRTSEDWARRQIESALAGK